jgi:2-(1,2-epoxy-1,2-dihydrophenyl)acetyl-CoA isomerase
MSEGVTREQHEAVCVLTLDSPDTRNALSVDMRTALREHLRAAMADDTVRAVVLTGAAGHFCSGGKLQPAADNEEPDGHRTRVNMGIMHDVIRLLANGPKPTIAAVEGYAFGAGLSLACACDLIVAADGAKFCAAFGRVGLMADGGLIWTLAKRVGAGRARDLLLTARIAEMAEGLRIGLCDRTAPAGGALAAARRLAMEISALAPLSLSATKQALAKGADTLEAVLATEADVQPRLTYSADYLEGRAAFREKRAPRFTGA